MKLTEAQIRSILENTVRKILREDEESRVFSAEQLRKDLRNELVNISEVAESYPPWKDWAEGTARSLLSRFSLGEVDLNEEDIQGLGAHLKNYLSNRISTLSTHK